MFLAWKKKAVLMVNFPLYLRTLLCDRLLARVPTRSPGKFIAGLLNISSSPKRSKQFSMDIIITARNSIVRLFISPSNLILHSRLMTLPSKFLLKTKAMMFPSAIALGGRGRE